MQGFLEVYSRSTELVKIRPQVRVIVSPQSLRVSNMFDAGYTREVMVMPVCGKRGQQDRIHLFMPGQEHSKLVFHPLDLPLIPDLGIVLMLKGCQL